MDLLHTQDMTLKQRVRWLFFDSDPEFTRFLSAVVMSGWCVQLVRRGDTFSTSIAFNGLASRFTWSPLGSENTWGMLAGWLAVAIALTAWRAQAAGVDEWRRAWNRRAHAVCLFLSTIWWLYITVSIYMAQPISTGPAAYGGAFIGSLWALWRYMARHDVIPRRVG